MISKRATKTTEYIFVVTEMFQVVEQIMISNSADIQRESVG